MEEHAWKFAGVWLPPDLLDKLRGGELNATEVMVYAVVQGLQGDKGCYAADEYLAGLLGASTRTVRRAVNRLYALDLVVNVNPRNRRRALFVVPKQPQVPTLPVPSQEAKNGLPAPSGRPKMASSGGQKWPPPGSDSIVTKKHTVAPTGAASVGCVVRKSKEPTIVPFHQLPTKPTKTQPTQADLDNATKLHQAILAKQATKPTKFNRAAWADHFRMLRDVDGIEDKTVAKVLAWYCAHLGEQYVPQAYSAQSFRTKFAPIQSAADRRPDAATVVVVDRVRAEARRLHGALPAMRLEELEVALQLSVNHLDAITTRLRERKAQEPTKATRCDIVRDAINGGPLAAASHWYATRRWRDGQYPMQHRIGPGTAWATTYVADLLQRGVPEQWLREVLEGLL